MTSKKETLIARYGTKKQRFNASAVHVFIINTPNISAHIVERCMKDKKTRAHVQLAPLYYANNNHSTQKRGIVSGQILVNRHERTSDQALGGNPNPQRPPQMLEETKNNAPSFIQSLCPSNSLHTKIDSTTLKIEGRIPDLQLRRVDERRCMLLAI